MYEIPHSSTNFPCVLQQSTRLNLLLFPDPNVTCHLRISHSKSGGHLDSVRGQEPDPLGTDANDQPSRLPNLCSTPALENECLNADLCEVLTGLLEHNP